MKFCVLALDYAGTLAEQGKARPTVLDALEEARVRGNLVMPAHGRGRVAQSRSGNVATHVMHQSPCRVPTLSKPPLARSRQNQESL